MSLAIDIDKVKAIKLDNQWYSVLKNSFDIDAYEFLYKGKLLYNGHTHGCATGCCFLTEIDGKQCTMYIKINAIEAVLTNET